MSARAITHEWSLKSDPDIPDLDQAVEHTECRG